MNIEDINYMNDPRNLALNDTSRKGFDEARMVFVVDINHEVEIDGEWEEVEERFAFPAKFEICHTCGGKGSHVNPGVDCGGLTRDDFSDDPDFESEYFSGRYDVTCYECSGKRVSPTIDEDAIPAGSDLEKALEAYYSNLADSAQFDAECRAERAMGA